MEVERVAAPGFERRDTDVLTTPSNIASHCYNSIG